MNPVSGAIAIALLALLAFVGANWLQTRTYEVQSPRLPASFDGYRIVQVSDLHNHQFGKNQVRLLNAIRQARPDLIVFTGDLTQWGAWDRRETEDLFLQLNALAPVSLVSGNHDVLRGRFQALVDFLRSLGVLVLQSEYVELRRGTESIEVAGISDPQAFQRPSGKGWSHGQWESALAELRRAVGDGYTILLSHRPEQFSRYASLGFDLVLAGHAHGGQVRLPFIGALYAPDEGWLPRYTSGVHASGRTKMVVSRGLGNSWFKIRLFNRPELVVVKLRRSAD